MEALGRAQACEAAGDHDGALEWVQPWAEAVHGPGTAGLQQLRIVSLKRLNRHDEAEAAIARYAGAHQHYPMEQLVRGAIAWSKGDWMTVLLAYLEAITWEPALQDLWPRVQVAATRLEGERECEKNDIERLKGLINRVVVTELTDDGMAILGTVVSVLPVDGEMGRARATAIERAVALSHQRHHA